MNTFGQLLRQYRRQSRDPMRGGLLTQARLGELLGNELGHSGYSGAAVSDWERDKSKIHADDRHVLAALIAVLHNCDGLDFPQTADEFLAAGNYRALDESEQQKIFPQTTAVPQLTQSIQSPNLPSPISQFPPLSPHRRKQQILLQKVEHFWVQGVLETAVHDAVLLDLGRERCDTVVAHPWQEIINTPTAAAPLTILDTFIDTDRALLILGTPGSGKTTTLITLAHDLIGRAQADETQPIPVILNLASWAENREPLDKWIVAELTAKYQIPRNTGRHWLEQDELVLLLDGLDEVARPHHDDCLTAINQFRETHGLIGLVVCSRVEDYETAEGQLKLGGAVLLRPLTPAQIETYLTAAGISQEEVHDLITQDTILQEMTQSALMLRVMSEVYVDETAVTPIPATDIATRRRQIFDAYINQMFTRRGTLMHPPAQTKMWLAWLARKMDQHNQVLFLLEQIQPSWLPTRRQQRLFILTSRLVDGLSMGVVIWMFWLLVRLTVAGFDSVWSDAVTNALPIPVPPLSLTLFILMFLILGLLAGAVDVAFYERRADLGDAYKPRLRDQWLQTAAVVLTVSLASFTLVGLYRTPFVGLASSLFTGVSFALTTYFIHGYSYRSDIRTVEALSWSWGGALVGLFAGLLCAAIFEFIEYQVVGQTPIFSTVFSISLLAVLLGGLRGNRLPTTSTPNQGIHLSRGSALVAASLFAIVMSLATAFFWGGTFGAIAGIIAAWVAGALYGAGSVANHFWLRLWLIRLGRMPRQYPEFLDEAANRVILNKVGGGYMFIHRLLQEHFSSRLPNGSE
ncbi:MAG: NACHT domain-containing protein [Chloroflexi bacterium]|nr:NACHT domain-containing protein [Chloroflexota bacterium]